MVPGEAGDPGQSVPRPVVEEQSPGGDCVTVQSRPTVAETVVVITLRRNSVTVTPVLSRVKTKTKTKKIKPERFKVPYSMKGLKEFKRMKCRERKR